MGVEEEEDEGEGTGTKAAGTGCGGGRSGSVVGGFAGLVRSSRMELQRAAEFKPGVW